MTGIDGERNVGAKIRVIGVGGAGGNSINTMIQRNLQGVELIAANTDMQDLAANLAPTKIQLGEKLTRGLGAGGNPAIGREAALESADNIRRVLEGADMVFVASGMGGGTGTGAAPVIAQLARELGALTVAVVTKPFSLEARSRMKRAEEGIRELEEVVDSLMVIPNERLNQFVDRGMSVLEAFRQTDEILYQAVRGIADLVTVQGFINLDFADIRAVMSLKGRALMGSASATGEDRAIRAAQAALNSQLLEGVSIQNARGALINITLGVTTGFGEFTDAANLIRQQVNEDAEVFLGVVLDETMADEIRVTVVATGFRAEDVQEVPASRAFRGTQENPLGSDIARPTTLGPTSQPKVPPRRRVFVGTVEDSEDGPRFERARDRYAAVKGSAQTASEATEPTYVVEKEPGDPVDLSIPAFMRRVGG